MATTKCDNCGVTLNQPPSQIKASKHHFCNASCKAQWMSKNQTGQNHPRWLGEAEATCTQCSKLFRRANTYKLTRNEHNFCSRQCFSEWKRIAFTGENNPQGYSPPIEKPCDCCGRPLKRKPWRVGETERRYHFCNVQCRADWQSSQRSRENSPLWQGGSRTYGPKWKAQAAKARIRDGNKCQGCGKTAEQNGAELDVHHIRPFRDFGYKPGENDNYKQANDLSNLITLCHTCHTRADSGSLSLQPK